MPSDLYTVRGGHPEPSGLIPRTVLSGSGAPTETQGIVPDSLYFDEDTGDGYKFVDGEWALIFSGGGGPGGATEIDTGTSDPVGAPSAGIVFFARTDVVRVLQWNGSAWVVIVSEV